MADYLNVPRQKLTYLLYILTPERCYRSFEIPKKSGGTRTIHAPNKDLKYVQKMLANALYSYQHEYRESEGMQQKVSHAFEKKRSIITNAVIHKNKQYVLNVDLENYFDSFHIGRVIGYFEKNRHFCFPHEVAVTIEKIACYQGKLPQGSACSPVITNLICETLDIKLIRLAKKYRLDYTRYADDITFSTNCNNFVIEEAIFQTELAAIIKSAGFAINHKKTRLQYRDAQQKVTGLVVNKKVNIDQEFFRETKAMANHLYREGIFTIAGKEGTLNQLEGRFAFINQIDKYNNKIDGQKHSVYYLNGRERQYQAFLFYRYFFCAEKPLIITEGKTDILYLKAALKNMYNEYPNRIARDAKGKYHYKVTFFLRSKKWEYFFGMAMDGADTITKIYRYYLPGGDTKDYLSYFRTMTGKVPKNPVVFLFDNETQTKDKPLKKFLADKTISLSMQKTLQEKLMVELRENSKLFLMTNPLPADASESEIEDLLPREILLMKIDGREFDRSGKKDKEKFYNKDVLSKYVRQHYNEIDFSGFKELLDALNTLVESQASAEFVSV